MASKKPKVVQTRNPRSGHYVKIDRAKGTIISHKATKGPYKGVPIARKKAKTFAIDYLKRAYLITGDDRIHSNLNAAVARVSKSSELRPILVVP